MRFIHIDAKNQPVSNEWYFYSSGREVAVTLSNPTWSGDAYYGEAIPIGKREIIRASSQLRTFPVRETAITVK